MGGRRKRNEHLSYSQIAEMEMDSKDTEHGEQPEKEDTKKSRNEAVSARNLSFLIKKQNYRCMLSGVALEPSEATLDHVIPLSKGGGHMMSNVKIVHKVINRMKGTLDEAEFVAWCRKVAAWNG